MGISQDIKSHLFFGGAPHQLSFCRIADQRVFENYGPIGPAEGKYHRVVQILSMPANHGMPSSILGVSFFSGTKLSFSSETV